MKAIYQQRIVPRHHAVGGESLNLELPSEELRRLNNVIAKMDPQVSVSLNFSSNEFGLYRVTGNVRTKVWLNCHLCQKPLSLAIDASLDMYLLHHENDLAKLTKGQDPFIMTTTDVSVAEIIEDDLIMALPLLPEHEDCSLGPLEGLEDNFPIKEEERHRPFAGLKEMLAQHKDKNSD